MEVVLERGGRAYTLRRRGERGRPGEVKVPVLDARAIVRASTTRRDRALLERVASGSRDHVAAVVRAIESGAIEVWSRELGLRGGSSSSRSPSGSTASEASPIEAPDVYSVVVELVDPDGAPVPFEPYRIALPDGRTLTRTLDRHGRDRVTGIRVPGTCTVCFHRRDAATWAPV